MSLEFTRTANIQANVPLTSQQNYYRIPHVHVCHNLLISTYIRKQTLHVHQELSPSQCLKMNFWNMTAERISLCHGSLHWYRHIHAKPTLNIHVSAAHHS